MTHSLHFLNAAAVRRTSPSRLKLTLLAGVATIAITLAAPRSAPAACEADCKDTGFSISVDGERLAGDAAVTNSGESSDIQVKYDGLEVAPVLNVSTVDLRRAYSSGEPIDFLASLNYPAWIDRKEVRIFHASDRSNTKPIAVLPVNASGHAIWTMPADGEGEFSYLLRVSDAKNRYDETVPLTLSRSTATLARHTEEPVVAAGYGEDRTAIRNIPVHGGAVTVYGTKVPEGETVTALGETVPVDKDGNFLVQRILPGGDHEVDVSVSGEGQKGVAFSREVNIPENDWFYVGIADLTVGKRFGGDGLEAANPDDYDDVYTKGRLAFYLKGKIKGKTLLTAAADTGEGKIGDLFSGFDSKNPRDILRRIDPDTYYPVYGDDSTQVEGAPTDGKFYVRLDRGDSHVMWGRYKANIDDTELLRNERTLHGASGVYRSEAATSFGERKTEATVYAAQPGTLPQRDILRGTGGSAYFLKRQDVSRDTETITVVTRDLVTGRVLTRQRLIAGEDYDINYLQGVVILKKPLPSTVNDRDVVRDAALGDKSVDLVVNYEYTPVGGAVDDYSYGGEASTWLNDHVRVGATGMSEETGATEQTAGGVNLRLRATDSTFVEGEFAASEGPGFSRTLSTDGGLTSIDSLDLETGTVDGEAWRLRGELDLGDVNPALRGSIAAWYEEKQAGFSTLDQNFGADQRVVGASGAFKLTGDTDLRLALEDYSDDDGGEKREASIEVEHKFSDAWALALGLTHTDLAEPVGLDDQNGDRTDAGARITYAPDEDTELYGFGQVTVERSAGIDRNDRIGAGAKRKLTEKVSVEAELSTGTSGIGALAALNYEPTAEDRYYAGYRLDPDAVRSTLLDGSDLGGVVVGAKRRYNDVLTGYTESKYDMFGKRRSDLSTYGVVYTPDSLWTVTGGIEAGKVIDANASDFDRQAFSMSAGYKDEDRLSGSVKGELRFEDSEDGTRDRDSFLLATAATLKISEDWRIVAGADGVFSNSDQSSLLDGDYVDVNTGFAYRPVDNDRLNILAKYQFLYDLPGPQQVTAGGSILGPAQRSHVVSADVNYDITKHFALGAKYGLRFGEVSATRNTDDFIDTSAQLAIIRADIRLVDEWDALLEARMLTTEETSRFGPLAAVYRNIGNNMKVGAGYNFTEFSDDLTDLTNDDQGAFVNAIGTF